MITFYISVIKGKLDRKINLTERDLLLAFVNGRLHDYADDDLRIFRIDIGDGPSISEVPISKIRERIAENKEKRARQEENARRRSIEDKIRQLQDQL